MDRSSQNRFRIDKSILMPLNLVILLIAFCHSIYAEFAMTDHKEKPNIVIVSGYHYKKIVDSLITYLPPQRFDTSIKYIKKQEVITNIGKDIDFIITIGRESTLRTNEYLMEQEKPVPMLAVLIPHKMYDSITKDIVNSNNKERQLTAIYREQPVERQLKVIENLLPEVKTIGVLTSMYDPLRIDELKTSIMRRNLNLVITENKKREELIDSLKHVLANCDLLLTLPDPEIYNPFTAKGILITSLRRGIPIIGYSKTYVDAGAVAAVYTKPGQIAQQAASMTNAFFLKNKLPEPNYPTQYAIAKNERILNMLKKRKQHENSKN